MTNRQAPFLVATLLLASLAPAAPPAGEEAAVLATVQKFFDSLAARDPALAREILVPEGRYFSVREDSGRVVIGGRTHREHIESLPRDQGRLLERMWEPKVLIAGRIAVAWTPYDFHRNGAFSHCGVDAFSLIKTDGGWKIAGVVYSVERTGCQSPLPPPASGKR